MRVVVADPCTIWVCERCVRPLPAAGGTRVRSRIDEGLRCDLPGNSRHSRLDYGGTQSLLSRS
jgi:hypothetical protein